MPIAEIDPPVEHRRGCRRGRAEAHVAARVVRHRGALVAEPGHVVMVEPDAVRHGEMRPDHAEPVEMRGLGLAVDPDAGHRLHLRLGDMAVQSDIEIARQARRSRVMKASEQWCGMVGATAGRTRSRSCDQCVQRVADRRQRRLAGRQPQRRDPLLQGRRQGVGEAGDRLVEGAVGDHRRDHRAHADFGIGRGDQRHARRGSAPAIRRTGRSRRCSPSAPSRPRRSAPTGGCPRRRGCRRARAPRSAAVRGSSGRPSPWRDCRANGCGR